MHARKGEQPDFCALEVTKPKTPRMVRVVDVSTTLHLFCSSLSSLFLFLFFYFLFCYFVFYVISVSVIYNNLVVVSTTVCILGFILVLCRVLFLTMNTVIAACLSEDLYTYVLGSSVLRCAACSLPPTRRNQLIDDGVLHV